MSDIAAFLGLAGALIIDEMEAEHYRLSASRELEPTDLDTVYEGRSVAWIGTEGRMMWVPAHYLRSRDSNPFYRGKLAEVVALVRQASPSDPISFYPGLGQATVIDKQLVAESLQYRGSGDGACSIGSHAPWTTGDDELDEYLADPEQFIEDRAWDDESATELRTEMEADLAEAVATNAGDLGEIEVQVRDGNHRVFGSIAGGESGVWMLIDDRQVRDIRSGRDVDAGRLIEELR